MPVEPKCPKCASSRFELVTHNPVPEGSDTVDLVCCSACGIVVGGASCIPDIYSVVCEISDLAEELKCDVQRLRPR